MPRLPKPPKGAKPVEVLVHADTRRNIPTAEFQSIAQRMEEDTPVPPARYARAAPLPNGEVRARNADLDPQIIWQGARIRLTDAQRKQLQETGEIELGEAQLVWRGKDAQDWSDLVVNPPPIYIQEKVHPKAIIDGLQKEARSRAAVVNDAPDLFADFNGLNDPEARLEFYQHDQHWSNRMILGDSLQVMASLAEREGLRGKVQCIYFDPPYGIKFNSNWQVSTLSRDVKDGKREDVSREPEQVKAFRDTWKDGIHSYLTYLRDRLTVARELLTESGSIFVQIGDENVHRVRAAMDEVFGASNLVSQLIYKTTSGQSSDRIAGIADYVLWFAKDIKYVKYRQLYQVKMAGETGATQYDRVQFDDGSRRALTSVVQTDPSFAGKIFAHDNMTSQRPPGNFPVELEGKTFRPNRGYWKTGEIGIVRLKAANRIMYMGNTLRYVRLLEDFRIYPYANLWDDTVTSGFDDAKTYVVQTSAAIIQRCVLMATDPGDLVLDPTCGSGTTATVAEQWGRRWITIDTSRVALALARTRLMAAKYPYYLLADSREGRVKEQVVSGRVQPDTLIHNDVRHGFVYERAPHVTLKSIANNAEIDVLWEEAQQKLEPLRARINAALGTAWEEWQIPREADPAWAAEAARDHAAWWQARIERQRRIDASIARRADIEYLYDRPYEDRSRVRVAGPFTVESLSPHRVVPADEDELLGITPQPGRRRSAATPSVDFATMVLDHLRTAGVHQSRKADGIRFTSLTPWAGDYIGAEGRFTEGETERRAAILIGPEFGTLSRMDLVTAAREASEAHFDVLIACAFNYDAHASELTKLGPLPILKARMNPDLHMAEDLKNTGKGNLFVVFGEPDLVVEPVPGEPDHVRIRILGVDVFDPQTGDIRSGDTKSIAAWFIDTDYNEESFYVRHAYFLGANDPYKSLKAALRAEIDEKAWATLYRDTSRPFPRPKGGRIAVKVINHFGDEVMKVFTV
ncbi:MAG: site-specific DNA-methyltransferase [Janthinobacterium lividum]